MAADMHREDRTMSPKRENFTPVPKWGRLCADQRGAVAVIVSLVAIPLIMAGGLAIDSTRLFVVKSRLAGALDATALAVGAAGGSADEMQGLADSYFRANYRQDVFGAPATWDMTVTDSTIAMSASASVPTTFMSLAGFTDMTVVAETEVTREKKGVELAMVLDVTGSMAGSKIASLRAASRDLLEVMFEDEEEPDHLKVSIVPYAAAVNPGAEAVAMVDPADALLYDPSDANAWKGCLIAPASPDDVEDNELLVGEYYDMYWWEPDTDNRWDDPNDNADFCDTYTGDLSGIETCDGDAPDLSTPHSNDNTGPNLGCPSPIVPLTNNRDHLLTTVDGLVHWNRGGTFSNTGMAWGWRTLSPGAPFTEGVDYDDIYYNKAVVLMTDGENQFYNWNEGSGGTTASDYTSYGRVSEGRIGSTDRHTANGLIDDSLADICINMKDAGIIVYTVTFALNDQDTKDLFEDCASGGTRYFDSPDEAALRSAFRAIGRELTNLHVSK